MKIYEVLSLIGMPEYTIVYEYPIEKETKSTYKCIGKNVSKKVIGKVRVKRPKDGLCLQYYALSDSKEKVRLDAIDTFEEWYLYKAQALEDCKKELKG